ncbi:MAG: hypothetical protein A3A96_02560 [Candidatus Zambryskibacteria bacterium RIFCSPLOWO2_01_FULL_39_39]|uniref:Uncharacterized protein n=1 Tax=Candidatus Zambryskibacteria bacterium RIFCSPLOWO2_01_FULL_39_39 TaxID=1802758 RepID=A0A1G2TZJ0_9BACT|nr:MAG: hypothetical protein A3A96_02560 [Candidatus Zambryskibacteria bacterium RIFCSPLOWO2_01_FULL_39_39]
MIPNLQKLSSKIVDNLYFVLMNARIALFKAVFWKEVKNDLLFSYSPPLWGGARGGVKIPPMDQSL